MIAPHMRACPKSPEIAQQLLKFLHMNAKDGQLMNSQEYMESAKDNLLPSFSTLRDTFGGWRQVAEWAGLRLQSAQTGEIPEYNEKARTITVEELFHETALPVIPGWRVLSAWDWRQQRYVPVAAQQVYMVR